VLEPPLRLRRATPADAAEIVRLRAAMFASMGVDGGDGRWPEAAERHLDRALAGPTSSEPSSTAAVPSWRAAA
jgi:hypothetical protein